MTDRMDTTLHRRGSPLAGRRSRHRPPYRWTGWTRAPGRASRGARPCSRSRPRPSWSSVRRRSSSALRHPGDDGGRLRRADPAESGYDARRRGAVGGPAGHATPTARLPARARPRWVTPYDRVSATRHHRRPGPTRRHAGVHARTSSPRPTSRSTRAPTTTSRSGRRTPDDLAAELRAGALRRRRRASPYLPAFTSVPFEIQVPVPDEPGHPEGAVHDRRPEAAARVLRDRQRLRRTTTRLSRPPDRAPLTRSRRAAAGGCLRRGTGVETLVLGGRDMAEGGTPADFERWVEPHLTTLARFAGRRVAPAERDERRAAGADPRLPALVDVRRVRGARRSPGCSGSWPTSPPVTAPGSPRGDVVELVDRGGDRAPDPRRRPGAGRRRARAAASGWPSTCTTSWASTSRPSPR